MKGKRIYRWIWLQHKGQRFKVSSDCIKTLFGQKTTQIGGRDTTIYEWNKFFKKSKWYSFNHYTQKWYVSQKEWRISKGKSKEVTQFYHDYFKQYFKTYITYYYNKQGRWSLIVTKDNYGTIEKKQVYLYEYY